MAGIIIKNSIESFLQLHIDGKSYVQLEARSLNPFLRCLEIMGETCLIEMVTGEELDCYYENSTHRKEDIFYNVYRKLAVYSEYSNSPYKIIVGIGAIPNEHYNGCGCLELTELVK